MLEHDILRLIVVLAQCIDRRGHGAFASGFPKEFVRKENKTLMRGLHAWYELTEVQLQILVIDRDSILNTFAIDTMISVQKSTEDANQSTNSESGSLTQNPTPLDYYTKHANKETTNNR